MVVVLCLSRRCQTRRPVGHRRRGGGLFSPAPTAFISHAQRVGIWSWRARRAKPTPSRRWTRIGKAPSPICRRCRPYPCPVGSHGREPHRWWPCRLATSRPGSWTGCHRHLAAADGRMPHRLTMVVTTVRADYPCRDGTPLVSLSGLPTGAHYKSRKAASPPERLKVSICASVRSGGPEPRPRRSGNSAFRNAGFRLQANPAGFFQQRFQRPPGWIRATTISP